MSILSGLPFLTTYATDEIVCAPGQIYRQNILINLAPHGQTLPIPDGWVCVCEFDWQVI